LNTVSIGLPVYNGENFLEEAIRSVVQQTYDDLELVICDNASTDRTGEICREFEQLDPRIRYFRNPENLGAAANYNLTWRNSGGKYFKWLAHDDRIDPRFLEVSVRSLEADQEAVLCNSVVRYIDSTGRSIGFYDSGLAAAGAARPSERFAAMVLPSHSCVDFFGLIRRGAMESSNLHGSFHGADRVFLAQLALRGRFIQVADPLVDMREHPNRYTRLHVSSSSRAAWHEGGGEPGVLFPAWRLFREDAGLVRHENLSRVERRRCAAALARWWFVNWNAFRVAAELMDPVLPGTVGAAERVKARLFGLAPGHFRVRESRPETRLDDAGQSSENIETTLSE